MVPCLAASIRTCVGPGDAVPAAPSAPADASPRRGRWVWRSSSDEGDGYHAPGSSSKREPTQWISSSAPPPPPPDSRIPTTPQVSLPPGVRSPPGSDAHSTSVGFRDVDCPVRMRMGDAFLCLRDDDEGWVVGWCLQLSCSANKQAAWFHRPYSAHEPPLEFLRKSPRRSLGPALCPGPHSQRPTDKLQMFPWNPGPARGSDQALDHLTGPWRIICAQEGQASWPAVLSRRTSTSPSISVAPCASTRTLFSWVLSCTQLQVLCTQKYATGAIEGMVVTGKFR